MSQLDRSFGRMAFGDDAAGYHAIRPPYPDSVWASLRERAGLRAGIDILEIGAGSGHATAGLLAHGPRHLLAIEPDRRLANFLRKNLSDPRLAVVTEPFEATTLSPEGFDLAASATAFHWLDAIPALQRIATALRPNGHVALWWHVFGEPGRPDRFHDATAHLFAGHATTPSQRALDRPPHALDIDARLADFIAAGFMPDAPSIERWTLRLDPVGIRALYATYSNVTALAPAARERLLDALQEIAATTFAGTVERNMTTVTYTASRSIS
jgi:SAM-dependent methyltransferase